MPCFHPLAGFRSKEINPKTGKNFFFVGSGDKSFPGMEYVPIPCGRCIGCRKERSRQWAVRCVHEASLYPTNCFVTLTFSEDKLPPGGSLVPHSEDFQLFMKRLRKRFGSGIRFFHCGEYGELLRRPHHHACIFNFDFPDKKLWSVREGIRLYRSRILEELWPYGFSSIGDVTFESAAYVARYCIKKINGDKADSHYKGLLPEYVTMSRRPGIGSKWLVKFAEDVYYFDHVVVRGHEAKPPRFYDNILMLTNPLTYDKIKQKRIEDAKANPDNSYSRLHAREVVAEANLKRMERVYETNSV